MIIVMILSFSDINVLPMNLDNKCALKLSFYFKGIFFYLFLILTQTLNLTPKPNSKPNLNSNSNPTLNP